MIDLNDIESARRRIRDRILPTPLAPSSSLSNICGVPIYLKLEHHQTTGSFKLRGAFNAILQLSQDERVRGVVAASTGNHGMALSFAANTCGVKATICMSNLVPENKVSEIRRLGADVRIVGAWCRRSIIRRSSQVKERSAWRSSRRCRMSRRC
ncbi:threonine dehydratase [Rhizobium tibeticum]|uniref:Threonine dehydratase n=1 Tax=Rhizobium tibeticum TaxID=501024 RepID=A0A1H8X2L6_9HYPH|nr:L-threonine dehydratase catabolic TdcB [Rhizobium tibeticum]SEP34154.1 threonine dehydratase [Rhizobium tibeticum]